MQLDSKESDIEQLHSKILDLQQGMESTSVTSLQPDETDGNVVGKRHVVFTAFSSGILLFLNNTIPLGKYFPFYFPMAFILYLLL